MSVDRVAQPFDLLADEDYFELLIGVLHGEERWMAVKVMFGLYEATIDKYRWTSPDAGLARHLNMLLDPDGPAGSDPDPDYTAARAAARELDGVIVEAHEADEAGEDDGEERIY